MGAGRINIFDVLTNNKIATLKSLANANQVFISSKNGVIAVKSTVGDFWFFLQDTFEFIGKLKLKKTGNTDDDFFYDEESNKIYGIRSDWNTLCTETLYIISVDTLQHELISLPQLQPGKSLKEGEKPLTRYCLHKCSKNGVYLICNCYNVGSGEQQIYESFYGRYEKECGDLILKEKRIATDKYKLELLNIVEPNDYPRFKAFATPRHLYLNHSASFRSGNTVYYITSEGIYRETELGEFEEVYADRYISDYAEFENRRYICTWKYCIVEDIDGTAWKAKSVSKEERARNTAKELAQYNKKREESDCLFREMKTFHVSFTEMQMERILDALESAVSLESFTVEEGNPAFSVENGLLYNADKTQLLAVPKGILNKVNVAEGITEIKDYLFLYREKMLEIALPKTLQKIGFFAFGNCRALEKVRLLEGLQFIGDSAFSGCTRLENIFIPESVLNIGQNAFSFCSKLTIYCAAQSKPEGWAENWNSNGQSGAVPTVWGASLNEDCAP